MLEIKYVELLTKGSEGVQAKDSCQEVASSKLPLGSSTLCAS